MEYKLTENVDTIPDNAAGGGTRIEGSFEGEAADIA